MQAYHHGADPDLYQQARICLDEGRYAMSLDLAQEWLLADPDDVRAAIVLCRSWLGLGNLDEAAAAFAGIEPFNQEIARLLKLMGDAYRGRGDNHRAINCYQRSMALLPGVAAMQEMQHAVAELLDEEGGFAGEEISGEGFQTLTMADLYIHQGHYAGAREILTAILAREPNDEEARRRLAGLMHLLNEKNSDLPIDKKTTVVHELSRWLVKLSGEDIDEK